MYGGHAKLARDSVQRRPMLSPNCVAHDRATSRARTNMRATTTIGGTWPNVIGIHPIFAEYDHNTNRVLVINNMPRPPIQPQGSSPMSHIGPEELATSGAWSGFPFSDERGADAMAVRALGLFFERCRSRSSVVGLGLSSRGGPLWHAWWPPLSRERRRGGTRTKHQRLNGHAKQETRRVPGP